MSDAPYRYDPATMRRKIAQDWLDALNLKTDAIEARSSRENGVGPQPSPDSPPDYKELDEWFYDFELWTKIEHNGEPYG